MMQKGSEPARGVAGGWLLGSRPLPLPNWSPPWCRLFSFPLLQALLRQQTHNRKQVPMHRTNIVFKCRHRCSKHNSLEVCMLHLQTLAPQLAVKGLIPVLGVSLKTSLQQRRGEIHKHSQDVLDEVLRQSREVEVLLSVRWRVHVSRQGLLVEAPAVLTSRAMLVPWLLIRTAGMVVDRHDSSSEVLNGITRQLIADALSIVGGDPVNSSIGEAISSSKDAPHDGLARSPRLSRNTVVLLQLAKAGPHPLGDVVDTLHLQHFGSPVRASSIIEGRNSVEGR